MISPLGGSRFPPTPEMEMHDPAGLLEIAAFVAILRNSTGSRSCWIGELVRTKQIRTYGFCRIIAGGKPRQCYVRFGSKADICSATANVR
jgi:hypothetical protein